MRCYARKRGLTSKSLPPRLHGSAVCSGPLFYNTVSTASVASIAEREDSQLLLLGLFHELSLRVSTPKSSRPVVPSRRVPHRRRMAASGSVADSAVDADFDPENTGLQDDSSIREILEGAAQHAPTYSDRRRSRRCTEQRMCPRQMCRSRVWTGEASDSSLCVLCRRQSPNRTTLCDPSRPRAFRVRALLPLR